jgi:hypothetical protein
MNLRIQVFAVFGSMIISAFIFELIRKRKLLEKYSLLWFSAALVLILLSLWRDLLEKTAVLGFTMRPRRFYYRCLFRYVDVLHFTSGHIPLTEQNNNLAQELGILREDLRQFGLHAQNEDGRR